MNQFPSYYSKLVRRTTSNEPSTVRRLYRPTSQTSYIHRSQGKTLRFPIYYQETNQIKSKTLKTFVYFFQTCHVYPLQCTLILPTQANKLLAKGSILK